MSSHLSSHLGIGKVQDVDIDPNGVFKYIQVEVKDSDGGTKRIVRGYGWAEYHADILDRVAPKLEEWGLSYECVGGGRIQHDCAGKKLFVYGYSMGFGRADHSVTVEKLKERYKDYASVTFSNDGY